ncbi:MAG TPA: hypothetical protein VNW95_03625 [Mucilaginibacter sp.]|nr:hypothetical protein [Mucilaginibacter sp.]
MIFKLPDWLSAQANRYVWYHPTFCFATSANTHLAEWDGHASTTTYLFHFITGVLMRLSYHLYFVFVGPG